MYIFKIIEVLKARGSGPEFLNMIFCVCFHLDIKKMDIHEVENKNLLTPPATDLQNVEYDYILHVSY